MLIELCPTALIGQTLIYPNNDYHSMEDPIDSQLDATLEALRELEKWKRRKEELENEIKNVNRQVAYYETIVKEMKEKISPENFRKLLDLS